jgi:hypothetical protein
VDKKTSSSFELELGLFCGSAWWGSRHGYVVWAGETRGRIWPIWSDEIIRETNECWQMVAGTKENQVELLCEPGSGRVQIEDPVNSTSF